MGARLHWKLRPTIYQKWAMRRHLERVDWSRLAMSDSSRKSRIRCKRARVELAIPATSLSWRAGQVKQAFWPCKVARASEPAVSPVSKPAARFAHRRLPTLKSAIRQVGNLRYQIRS